VSMKMAAAIANKSQRVLLVDMDFFSPKLSSKVEPEFEIGLSNYLMSECDLQTIIKPTEIDSLHFVNAGNADGHKELFYNNKILVEFIEWARANYDIVIFDTPAAIYIPDIVDFFDYIDGIFVIVRLRRTTRTMLNKLFKMLTAFNTKYIAAVINDFYEGQGGAYDDYNYSARDYYKEAENNKGLLAKIKRPRKSILFVIILSVIGLISIVSYLYKNSFFPFDNHKPSQIEVNNDEVSSVNVNNTAKFESEYAAQTNMDSVIVSTEKRFDEIALTHFGNQKFWVYIYLVNKNKGVNPYNLKQGDVVYLPSVDNYDMNTADPQSVEKAVKIEKEILAGNL
ncbi:MAG: tyrosine-protein kinase family protein, partial [Paludibacter sp.]